MELTLEKAEQLCKESFKDFDEADRDFFILHAKLVGEIAGILGGEEVDKELLKIVGWVQDIGRVISEEGHEKHSVEILEKEYELNETMRDCILNHGSKGEPKTKEGELIQTADKLFVINPELISLLKKHSFGKEKEKRNKDFEFIRRLCNKSVDLLEKDINL